MTSIATVNFRGTELVGFRVSDAVYVALKPIVDSMGLDWSAQRKRVKRDPILSEGVAMMAIPSGRGGKQEAVCLRLDLLNGWLFRIDATRVSAGVRDRIQLYQRECYRVLHAFFYGGGDQSAHEERDRLSLGLRLVDQCRLLWGQRAGAELWKELGLPHVPAMDEQPAQKDLFYR